MRRMRHTYLWIAQLVTAALIVVFLGIHMLLMHLEKILSFFGAEINEPTSWGSMIERASKGSWLTFYILFLAFVVYHGFNGLRGVLIELTPSPRTERAINWAILILGIIAFTLGTYVPVALFQD